MSGLSASFIEDFVCNVQFFAYCFAGSCPEKSGCSMAPQFRE